MNKKLESKLKKLLSLARHGTRGEAVNAGEMLEGLMLKHNITLEEIEGEKIEEVWFRYKSIKFHSGLMNQILYKVGNGRDSFKGRYHPNQFLMEVTAAERMEVEMSYEIYSKALDDEMSLTYDAFIQAQGIFPESPADESTQKPLSLKELVRLETAMSRIEKVSIRKSLGCN
ncbi:MAG: hypothetical protein ACSHX0_06805 [Akkermansiaceae bacterium]